MKTSDIIEGSEKLSRAWLDATYKIKENPKDYDSDDLIFDQNRGFGYVSKDKKSIGLIRCPECGRENHGLVVSKGICAWCGFDANKLYIIK